MCRLSGEERRELADKIADAAMKHLHRSRELAVAGAEGSQELPERP